MNIARKILAYLGLITVVPSLVAAYLYFYPSAFNATTEKRILIILTSVLVSLGVIALLKLVLYLSKISASLATMSNGNFNHRIEPAPAGIEAEFANSINHISKQLRESADELERRALLIDRSNQELKRMGEVKLNFLSEVAHELRTPLINIEKSSAFLIKGYDGTPQQRSEFLRIINENAERLMRLINELLDMSKLEAGMFVLKRGPADVRPVLEEAAASIERWRLSKNIDLRLEAEDDLPQIYADRDRVVQVIINLLSNAVKFTPAGGKIGIRAGLYSGSFAFNCRHVEISVSDAGPGIAGERLASIFEKYKSVEHPDAAVPSTGLGLPISKEIVETHEGRIWVTSQPGKGSIFSFTIPCFSGKAG